MAKLRLPEKAYYNEWCGDQLWHLKWAGVGGGPTMVCGRMIYSETREERDISEIDPKDLCDICLGAIGVER